MSKDLMELVDGCPIYSGNHLTPEGTVLVAGREKTISEYRELGFTKATEEMYQENLTISKRQRIYEFEYRIITTEAIRKFLQRKVKLYDKEHKPEPKKKTSSRDPYSIFPSYLLEQDEPQPGDVFNISVLERMREVLIRSAQQQLAIHSQEMDMRAIERRRQQIAQYGALNAINDSNPNLEVCSIYEKTCDYDKLDPETIGRFEWKEERVEDYDGLPPVEVLETFKEHKAREAFDCFTIASVNSVPDPLLLGRIDGDEDNRWFIDNWGTDVCLDDLI